MVQPLPARGFPLSSIERLFAGMGVRIAVTRTKYRAAIALFAGGYTALCLVVALVSPVALRVVLAVLALAPILWSTWILLSARIPPPGVSFESLRAVGERGDRRRNAELREAVDRILEEIRRMERLARGMRADSDRERLAGDLKDSGRRLIELVREVEPRLGR